MKQNVPYIQEDLLIFRQDGQEQRIQVGSQQWYNWLKTAKDFTVPCKKGHYKAHKEFSSERAYW